MSFFKGLGIVNMYTGLGTQQAEGGGLDNGFEGALGYRMTYNPGLVTD